MISPKGSLWFFRPRVLLDTNLVGRTTLPERAQGKLGGGNMESLVIGQAMDEDIEEIKGVIKEAFYRPGKNEDFNEWNLADKVRTDAGFVPELCLVASINEEIVGYILLSKASIGNSEGLALGPIAVKPAYQRKGIGKRLVDCGLKRAQEKGFPWVALTGGDYYTQFGFEAASKYRVMLSDNHPENPYLKIRFLVTNKDTSGRMTFCDSFYDQNGELL